MNDEDKREWLRKLREATVSVKEDLENLERWMNGTEYSVEVFFYNILMSKTVSISMVITVILFS